jgi:hypothetical protein|tara:strand:- start:531 stop:776 length:246 start_codon:yes stop_codon:yes gene_type:complete
MIAKLMMKLLALVVVASLLIGCDDRTKLTEARFYETYCEIEDQRRFSQAEWDWRQINASWNLDRDIAVNLRREKHCPKEEQ